MKANTTMGNTDLEPSDIDGKMEQILTADKPLTATQQKSLERVVEGDFNDLRSRVQLSLSNRFSEKVDEITADYADIDKQVEAAQRDLHDRIQTICRAAEKKAEAAITTVTNKHPKVLVNRANARGEVIPATFNAHHAVTFAVEGKNEALEAARRAYERLQSTSRMLIDAEERKVQRAILLQGVGGTLAARDLIATLPNLDDVLSMVEAELGVSRSEDLAALMPPISDQ